jgi:hypothetical protein
MSNLEALLGVPARCGRPVLPAARAAWAPASTEQSIGTGTARWMRACRSRTKFLGPHLAVSRPQHFRLASTPRWSVCK